MDGNLKSNRTNSHPNPSKQNLFLEFEQEINLIMGDADKKEASVGSIRADKTQVPLSKQITRKKEKRDPMTKSNK